MPLNNLSGKAWMKLTKNVWMQQKVASIIKQKPFDFNNPYLFINKTTRRKTTMPLSSIDENLVNLIELLTLPDQLVYDPYVENDAVKLAANACNRQFINAADIINHEYDVNLLLAKLPKFTVNDNHVIDSYHDYLRLIRDDVLTDLGHVKQNGYVVLIVEDVRYQNIYYDIHSDIARLLKKVGLTLQGLITLINERQHLRPYGYPNTFVPNIVHHYAIIARVNNKEN